MNNFSNKIHKLLQDKAEIQARLALLPYNGSPEIKENSNGKYLYIRKRVGSRLTSKYVGVYSDELYNLLLKNKTETQKLKKELRKINKELLANGYTHLELPSNILINLDFARSNLKSNIYDQAVLEGITTTFPQTEEILERGLINNVLVEDVQKILNLKHAWEFILDTDIIQSESNYDLLSHIATLVNEGFFQDGGRIRGIPVTIGGSTYTPPIPIEFKVKEDIEDILNSTKKDIDKAVELCMYCMRTQIFIDGNKRSSIIFVNHFMISRGLGLLIINKDHVAEFKKLLVNYYESANLEKISSFLKKYCWKKLD